MTTITHNYSWSMPDPGGSANTWGNTLNATTQAIDAQVWALNTQVTSSHLNLSSAPSISTPAFVEFNNGEAPTGQQVRWTVAETAEPETGGNAGSNFQIAAWSDTGVALGSQLTLTRQGTAEVTGTLAVDGNVYISQATNSGQFYLGQQGTTYVLSWSAHWYDAWDATSGARTWAGYPGVDMTLMSLDGGGNFAITGSAAKPGGGSWAATSDARIKTVIGSYSAGLDEVTQLNPVTYVYKGNDSGAGGASPHALAARDGTPFVGFVAQDLEAVFPDMVSKNVGYIDGQMVTDLRQVDTTNLVFALVNAVKTLAAEVAELKAGR